MHRLQSPLLQRMDNLIFSCALTLKALCCIGFVIGDVDVVDGDGGDDNVVVVLWC